MKIKKFVGIFNLIVSVLLFAIIFLSSFYELNAFAKYVNSLEDSNFLGLAVIVIVVFILFSVPLALLFFILTLVAGIKTMRGRCGKGPVIMGVVAKILATAGLVTLFLIYLDLYPAGWLSKGTYLLTAFLALGSSVLDLIAVRFFVRKKKVVEYVEETEAQEEIASTEE